MRAIELGNSKEKVVRASLGEGEGGEEISLCP
jgi:hypothetical protein